ncbi:MAG TPA: V-type ATPase subunit [Candidatus Bathyarchaeia archaeon]|nr:V-type ATPase subunit [Candidatus Bathyarchaeia archaeon]
MTSAGKYAELAAATRSFKAELIRREQTERLVEAGTLSETVSLLTDGKLTFGEGSEIGAVESYLIKRVIEVADALSQYAPHDSRPLIKHIAKQYEYGCVKEVLKAIADQEAPEDAMRHLAPAGKFTFERCKELIESRNPGRVIEELDDEGMKKTIASKLSADKSALGAVLTIDQYYYTKLWSASNLPDPLDAQSARGLVGQLIDHLNILLAFRARLIGLDSRSTADLLIPVNYALGHALTELADATNMASLMRIIEKTPYVRAFQGQSPVESDVGIVELALLRNHAKNCFDAFAGSPFNVGLALSLLFLKTYELRDLFSIINAKANIVPNDRITDSLILL